MVIRGLTAVAFHTALASDEGFDASKATFLVHVEIAGATADRVEKWTKGLENLEACRERRAEPIWNDRLEFDITDTDLAVVLITAWHQSIVLTYSFVGQYAFPLAEIQPGWR